MEYPQTAFVRTKIDQNCLIGRRRQAVVAHTLRYQLDVLKSTGRYDAFRLKWHPTYDDAPIVWPIPNHLFWDSDVAKWIEGACYFLQEQSLPDIDAAVQELVDMVAQAQQPDGYLNIHYTVVAPGKRFTNLKDMHELYNAGHLIEAALAHEGHYGNGKLLGPMLKYVDLIDATFGPSDDRIHGYPGHPEMELALLRLYARTGDPKHLALARYFLTERGNPTGVNGRHFFDAEAEARGDDPTFRPAFYPEPRSLWYHQAHKPIVDQQSIEGHSVRAVYLLTAYTDLLRIDDDALDSKGNAAMRRLWDSMVERKMYVTGGIGAIRQWEGFGLDYFLPQSLDEGGCYAETCAAIGVMMWAQRRLQTHPVANIGDIMELCLYNAVLTSMSRNGKSFTYHNQLASSEGDLDKRADWFTVACCPPNIMRLLGHIGGYIWTSETSHSKNATVGVHLFVSSTLRLPGAHEQTTVSQTTQWPSSNTIDFRVDGPATLTLKIRIPSWAVGYQLEPKCATATIEDGYLILPPVWIKSHPTFALSIPLRTRWISPHPLTGQDIVSLARGPVIYCVEDYDNAWVDDHFKTTYVDTQAQIEETAATDQATGETWVALAVKDGCRVLHAQSTELSPHFEYKSLQQKLLDAKMIPMLKFVPYGLRSNRGGKGHMRVGLRTFSGCT